METKQLTDRRAKVAEMRAKLAAGTADLPHKMDIAFDRMIEAVTPRVISQAEHDQMDAMLRDAESDNRGQKQN